MVEVVLRNLKDAGEGGAELTRPVQTKEAVPGELVFRDGAQEFLSSAQWQAFVNWVINWIDVQSLRLNRVFWAVPALYRAGSRMANTNRCPSGLMNLVLPPPASRSLNSSLGSLTFGPGATSTDLISTSSDPGSERR